MEKEKASIVTKQMKILKTTLFCFFAATILLEVALFFTNSKIWVLLRIALPCIFFATMVFFAVREIRKDALNREDGVLLLSSISGLWPLLDFISVCKTYHLLASFNI